MQRKGMIQLPLHSGHAPAWLTKRMEGLAYSISKILINEHGKGELLRRLSDPLWFQAFGCVLGFDWHSSGVTTVVTGVLKRALKSDIHGIVVAGGKGKRGTNTPQEIVKIAEAFSLSDSKIEEMVYASRMAAKVDNSLLQDNYTLYHHAFIISEDGSWAVVQQGMDPESRTARRYHWISGKDDFVNDPRSGIICNDIKSNVLDLTSSLSKECRETSLDIARGEPNNTISSIHRLNPNTLDRWIYNDKYEAYSMPRRLNWEIFRRIYDIQPRNYEELIAIKGVGASTVRALALVAELIYGSKASWNDPVKFTFAHGGKDGVPYPVDRRTYDKSIEILKGAIEGAEVEREAKVNALKRLVEMKQHYGLL